MTRALANDLLEAAERAGGFGRVYELIAGKDRWGVSFTKLDDVALFLRCLASLGVTGTVSWSAATGWTVAE